MLKEKPCPMCGSESVDIESTDSIALNVYVYCLECKYEGELAKSSYVGGPNWADRRNECIQKAIELWNDDEKRKCL